MQQPDLFSLTPPASSTQVKSSKDFAHLHVHSHYSLLDGVSSPADLAEKAAELRQPALALTDHGYMFGSYKFQAACDEHGVKAIHGVEAYYCDDINEKKKVDGSRQETYHLVLLAADIEGWRNLCELATLAGRDGFHYRPRLDTAMLSRLSDGIIATSACYKSPISFHLTEEGYDPDKARSNLRVLKGIFGDRFYNEVMYIGMPEYDSIVPRILDMADAEGLKTVVTNDVHYAMEGGGEIQNVLLNINTNGGMDGFESSSLYMKTRDEIIAGPILPEHADTTMEVVDRINFRIDFKGYHFPNFDISSTNDFDEFKQWRARNA